jgi:hypothetical protein
MALNTIQDIEQAITTLSAQELEELYVWMDRHQHPIDAQLQSDFSAGHLDKAIDRALSDEQGGRVLPL